MSPEVTLLAEVTMEMSDSDLAVLKAAKPRQVLLAMERQEKAAVLAEVVVNKEPNPCGGWLRRRCVLFGGHPETPEKPKARPKPRSKAS